MATDRERMEAILAQVRANAQRLDLCPGPHDFSIDTTPQKPIAKTYRCTKCGGELGQRERLWYLRGLKHGRGG